MNGPFHPGELHAQQLAGKGSSGGAIRDYMPDQHREFFAMLPFVLVATVAADGWPRARVLSGAPGFVHSPDPATLRVAAAIDAPAGSRIGLLGLDFGTRRRNRANGTIATV
ncbi:MAG: pyridoxamine 5'-phosphate oxidase family protein, partial [Pseudomonadota bacterium]